MTLTVLKIKLYNQLSLKGMEFTVTKSKSTQNSQISSLACENQCKSQSQL